jgi:hypothetical protein
MNEWQLKEPPTRGDGIRRWFWIRFVVVVAAILLAVGFFVSYAYSPNRPEDFADIREQFKYGSIGSDYVNIFNPQEEGNGLPLEVMKILPRMFPQYLPAGGPKDYTAFGFIQEKGHPMPIGFGARRCGVDLAGINCAACHVGSVRQSEQEEPKIVLAMPSNTVDLQGFFEFLFDCAHDSRFNPDEITAEMEKDGALFPLDRAIYREAVTRLKSGLLKREKQLSLFLTTHGEPRFGPGRVDTFNPYKGIQFEAYYRDGIPTEEKVGMVDFPSIWNQRVREGMHLHWDGNNTSVQERNVSAAFGAGATRDHVDLERINRVLEWLKDLPPPAFPWPDRIDRSNTTRGAVVYAEYCLRCHDPGGAEVGQVAPLNEIGTDPHRLDSYTQKLEGLQHDYGKGYPWSFEHFRKTDGYANMPLDGVWARAPYLHNGSVPTLWDLLQPADKRPDGFWRGHDIYDSEKVGFRTDVQAVGGRKSFWFDTKKPGNGKQGHSGKRYGTELGDDDKRALLEYLKTL